MVSGFFASRKEKMRQVASEKAFDALASHDFPAFAAALAKGASAQAWNAQGLRLLHQVAQSGRSAFLEALVRSSVSVDIDDVLPDGRTPLWVAVAAGNTANALWLLDAGAKVDQRGPGGQCPLHLAARAGSTTLLRALSARKVHWDVVDARGQRPLDLLRQHHPARARLWQETALANP